MSESPPRQEVTFYNDLEQLPTDVRQLFERAEKEHVESSLDWYRCLAASVLSKAGETSLAVVRRDGEPVVVLPLLVRHGAHRNRVESLANYYTAIYAPILSDDADAADLGFIVQALLSQQRGLAILRFSPLDPMSNGYDMLNTALRATGWLPFKYFCFGNWFHRVAETWPDYLKAREGAVRSTLKRMGKKFTANGGSLELIVGGDQLEAALTAYQEVYAASWKAPEPHPTFIPSLVHMCARRGWLRLGVARLAGRPIAAQLWIVAHGKASIYKLAYHEDFKAYAPGTLLTAMLMEHVIEHDNVHEIDYLIGDDEYKKAWMSQRRERWGLVAYNPRTLAGLKGAGLEALGRTVKSVRRRLSRRLA